MDNLPQNAVGNFIDGCISIISYKFYTIPVIYLERFVIST